MFFEINLQIFARRSAEVQRQPKQVIFCFLKFREARYVCTGFFCCIAREINLQRSGTK